MRRIKGNADQLTIRSWMYAAVSQLQKSSEWIDEKIQFSADHNQEENSRNELSNK